MIQATYTLNGKIVYEMSSNKSIKEKIVPGTLNDQLFNYLCN